MRIIKVRDYQDMSRKAANVLSAQIILKPNSVLGLATGSTPIGLYDQLVDWYGKGDLDFALAGTVVDILSSLKMTSGSISLINLDFMFRLVVPKSIRCEAWIRQSFCFALVTAT